MEIRARFSLRPVAALGALAIMGFSLGAFFVTDGRTAPSSSSPPLSLAPGLPIWTVQAKDLSRASVVPSPGRAGQAAMRLEVMPGDTDVAGSGSNADRTDAMIPASVTDAAEGRDQWWSWSTYFPADYHPTPSTAWNIFLDFHNTGEDGQANINFLANAHVNPAMLEMTIYGGSSVANPPQTTLKLGRIHLNQWFDFTLHVIWSSNPRLGLVELYLDGKRIVRPLRRATLYAGQQAYLKVANYRQDGPQPSAILTAGVRRSSSFADAVRGFRPFALWARRLTLHPARG